MCCGSGHLPVWRFSKESEAYSRGHLPVREHSNSPTLQNTVPLAGSRFRWGINEDLDCILWVFYPDVWGFTNIFRVGSDIRFHGFKVWHDEHEATNLFEYKIPFFDSNDS